MKHKTAELEGALLDAAVAKAMGATARIAQGPTGDPLCFARGAPDGLPFRVLAFMLEPR